MKAIYSPAQRGRSMHSLVSILLPADGTGGPPPLADAARVEAVAALAERHPLRCVGGGCLLRNLLQTDAALVPHHRRALDQRGLGDWGGGGDRRQGDEDKGHVLGGDKHADAE